MKTVESIRARRLTALLLAAALMLTSCGGGTRATTMHLKRTEGRVSVSDGGGKDVEPREDLGLYSGYGVDTRSESYAWIGLDEVKLTKLDQDSEIEIQKDGKTLEIIVNEGSLFFNVTQPLGDDETMTIRTSSMMVGIRGTCGWVEVPDSDTMRVFLLEGKVRCEVDGEHETVITVEQFTAADVPEFVAEEIEDDDDLAEAILDDSGIDLTGGEAGNSLSAYTEVLKTIRSNGEVLYTEILDFEGDGSPELLVLFEDNTISPNDHRLVLMSIYRKGPEGIDRLFYSGIGGDSAGDKVTLMESDGRLYIMQSFSKTDYMEERYYGSVAQRDGGEPDWGYLESLSAERRESEILYRKSLQDEHGLMDSLYRPDGSINYVTAEEYETARAKYTELRVLVYSPDGVNLIVTPDPSEIEEPPMPTGPEPAEPEPAGPEPQQPEEQPVQASETLSELPAEFTGEYTAENSGKYFPVTFSANGKCDGGGLKNGSGPLNHYGSSPQSIVRSGDGSVAVTFSYCTYTFYPAGHDDNQYSDRIGLKYVSTTSSGYSTDWYYK